MCSNLREKYLQNNVWTPANNYGMGPRHSIEWVQSLKLIYIYHILLAYLIFNSSMIFFSSHYTTCIFQDNMFNEALCMISQKKKKTVIVQWFKTFLVLLLWVLSCLEKTIFSRITCSRALLSQGFNTTKQPYNIYLGWKWTKLSILKPFYPVSHHYPVPFRGTRELLLYRQFHKCVCYYPGSKDFTIPVSSHSNAKSDFKILLTKPRYRKVQIITLAHNQKKEGPLPVWEFAGSYALISRISKTNKQKMQDLRKRIWWQYYQFSQNQNYPVLIWWQITKAHNRNTAMQQ